MVFLTDLLELPVLDSKSLSYPVALRFLQVCTKLQTNYDIKSLGSIKCRQQLCIVYLIFSALR